MAAKPTCPNVVWSNPGPNAARLGSFLNTGSPALQPRISSASPVLGVIRGTGIGPEVIDAALDVLRALEETLDLRFEICQGGPVGEEAESQCGDALPEAVKRFVADVFEQGGAILSGPGGGRYVYDLRKQFNLFCKFVPVKPWPELARAGRVLRPAAGRVDLLLVRDNIGGVYQGEWGGEASTGGRSAWQSFGYDEHQVRRLMEVAARAAAARRGRLHIIVKDGGVPSISALWREVGLSVAEGQGIEARLMNADLAAYELIQHPELFDVMVTPNLFGDILADLAGVLVGSRGLTFSGNFDPAGRAVYQTNHGCARDLVGTDTANPAGQILSLTMLLRESFGLDEAAGLIETALAETWSQGWRTADLAEPGCRVVGTKALADRVAQEVVRIGRTSESATQPA
jgi:3-isopropylmalate dehydrogenase